MFPQTHVRQAPLNPLWKPCRVFWVSLKPSPAASKRWKFSLCFRKSVSGIRHTLGTPSCQVPCVAFKGMSGMCMHLFVVGFSCVAPIQKGWVCLLCPSLLQKKQENATHAACLLQEFGCGTLACASARPYFPCRCLRFSTVSHLLWRPLPRSLGYSIFYCLGACALKQPCRHSTYQTRSSKKTLPLPQCPYQSLPRLRIKTLPGPVCVSVSNEPDTVCKFPGVLAGLSAVRPVGPIRPVGPVGPVNGEQPLL